MALYIYMKVKYPEPVFGKTFMGETSRRLDETKIQTFLSITIQELQLT